MIKNLAITVPTIGRISIGHIEEAGDRRLPKKDNFFRITTQFKQGGDWVEHPVAASLRKNHDEKLTSIPVRLMFDKPELNFRYRYELFDKGTKRQLCVGDGEKAKRLTTEGKIQDVDCPGADRCPFGAKLGCKIFGRLYVQIEGQKNDLATFIHRTRGFNATKALQASINGLAQGFPGLLAGMPLTLKLRGKSSSLSHGSLFFYADLELRDGATLAEAAKAAKDRKEELEATGFKRDKFEEAYLQGLQASPFDETSEEADELEEWFLEDEPGGEGSSRKEGAGQASGRSERRARSHAIIEGNACATGLGALRRSLTHQPPEATSEAAPATA